MAPKLHILAGLIALVGILLWCNGRAFNSFLLPTHDFPIAYFSGGPHDSQCTTLRNPDQRQNELKYCEDATFWDLAYSESGELQDRLVIASCEPGRKAWHLLNGPLRDAEPRVYPAYSSQDDSFMYVVNHAKNGGYITTIEQFSISWSDPTIATHIRTISSPHFVSLNALALTSPTSFYVTNDHYLVPGHHGFLDEALYMVETLFGLSLSWVSHVSIHPNEENSSVNVEHEVVARGIAFANGISLSGSGETVAVASSSLAEVLLFNRKPSSNALSFSFRIPLPFAPDNLAFYCRDGHGHAESLIVAGHPHFPSLGSVAQNVSGAIAPSWVLSLAPRPQSNDTSTSSSNSSNTSSEYDTDAPVSASRKANAVESHEARTLYQSDGRAFGTSASGLWDADGNGAGKGVLYVAGIFEEGLLMCSEA